MVARGEGGWEGWLKMVKGLRSPDWQLQNSCVDLKYSIENVVNNNGIKYVWCPVGTGNTGGGCFVMYQYMIV